MADIFPSAYIWLSVMLCRLIRPDDVIQNGSRWVYALLCYVGVNKDVDPNINFIAGFSGLCGVV